MERLTDWELHTLIIPLEKELKNIKDSEKKIALKKLKDKLIRAHLFGRK